MPSAVTLQWRLLSLSGTACMAWGNATRHPSDVVTGVSQGMEEERPITRSDRIWDVSAVVEVRMHVPGMIHCDWCRTGAAGQGHCSQP